MTVIFENHASERPFGSQNKNREPLPTEPQDLKALVDELDQEVPDQTEASLKKLSEPIIDPNRFQIQIDAYQKNKEPDFFDFISSSIKKHVEQLSQYLNFTEFEESVTDDYGKRRWGPLTKRTYAVESILPFLSQHDIYQDAFESAANSECSDSETRVSKKKSIFSFLDNGGDPHQLIEYEINSPSSTEDLNFFHLITDKARKHLSFFAEQVFNSLQSNLQSGLNTITSLQNYVKKVAFLEWLNAHRWYFLGGCAGVAQMMTRIFLDAAKIKNGTYKVGLDPNMEAFITPAKKFIEDFPHFFTEPLTIEEEKK